MVGSKGTVTMILTPIRALLAIAAACALAACAEPEFAYPMHNPQTGERIVCTTGARPRGPMSPNISKVDRCVSEHTRLGFVAG